MQKVKQLLTTKTTQKGFWLLLGGSGVFVCVCVVAELNNATMDDFHQYLSFAWKAFLSYAGPKAAYDGAKAFADAKKAA